MFKRNLETEVSLARVCELITVSVSNPTRVIIHILPLSPPNTTTFSSIHHNFLIVNFAKSWFLFQQTFQLGLFRSDYFADSAANFGIKQVEFNTIASSFGGIATNISQYNRYVLQELGHEDKVKNLPTNGALQGICEALAEAWTIYADPR
uniref:Glutathione synthetase n=1 Tax=Timema shepardi TaxID=629360 RepID=A0A7R9G5M1_TIMSH|nr:unnamed protein product [Timema shepardi]